MHREYGIKIVRKIVTKDKNKVNKNEKMKLFPDICNIDFGPKKIIKEQTKKK